MKHNYKPTGNVKIHPKLKEFLKRHGALTAFRQNCKKDSPLVTEEKAKKYIETGHFWAISAPFYWVDAITPKRTKLTPGVFWSKLNDKWKKEIK